MQRELTPEQLVGRRLRYYREQAGWNLRDFASEAGFNHTMVSRVERGSQNPSPRLLKAYEDILGLRVMPDGYAYPAQAAYLSFDLIFAEQKLDEFIVEWRGQTADNFFTPELYFVEGERLHVGEEAEDRFDARNIFGPTPRDDEDEVFGRVRVGETIEPHVDGWHHTRSHFLVSAEDYIACPYEAFSERWIVRSKTDRNTLSFSLPHHTNITDFELSVRADTTNSSTWDMAISWNGELLSSETYGARYKNFKLGLLHSKEWYTISWEPVESPPRSILVELSHRLEQYGWLRISRNLWQNEKGHQLNLDQVLARLRHD